VKQNNELNKKEQSASSNEKKRLTPYRNPYLSVEKHGENGKLFEPPNYDNGYNGARSRNNH